MALKIIINQDVESRIDDILEPYFLEAYDYDTFYPVCWKKTIFSLNLLINGKKNPFERNVTEGIRYLTACIWHTVCRRCDHTVFEWFYRFSKAWLNRNELPIFLDCTCSQEDSE